jgi:predicted AAA+ superfamily ATPase
MQPDNLVDIIQFWSFWETTPTERVTRNLRLPTELESDLVLVIQGVRRCGKSTLLTQLPGAYHLDLQHCLFINFEDPRLVSDLNSNLLFAICEVLESRASKDAPLYYFFDEIQEVEGWEKWLHSRLERDRRSHFVITGSNASLLSGDLSSSLTGRHRTIELFPFDLLEAHKIDPTLTAEQFLAIGGFPKALLTTERTELLQQYFRDIVERDIANHIGVRSVAPLLQTIKIAFESCGSEISIRKIAGSCGISPDTVSVYLRAAEAAYLLFECPYFAYSARKQLVRNKKYYPIDTGLRHAVIVSSGKDRGKSLETAAFLALKRRYREVFYWKQKGEVDFVVIHKGKPLPIQITWAETLQRHEQALEEFYGFFPDAHEALVLTHHDLQDNFVRLED